LRRYGIVAQQAATRRGWRTLERIRRRTASRKDLRGMAVSTSAPLAPVRELVSYRELIRNLVARDLKVRYRNSILGFLWCLVNPLLMMGVFTFVFTILMRNTSIPDYPVFILVGILAWNFHQIATMGAIASIVGNSNLIMKVYFPREVLPISAVLSNAVNFALALIALFAMIAAFRIHLSYTLVFLPLILLVQITFDIGVALILSSLTVFFRDIEIIMETLLTAWFFLTPIIYRMQDLFPAYSRLMYIANPMASIVESYRDVLYAGGMPGLDFLGRTFVTSLVILAVGYWLFRRTARHFGEEL
jgi:lipopolysaccharide transport system permease protein